MNDQYLYYSNTLLGTKWLVPMYRIDRGDPD
jgi:hypothetical protein